MRPDTVPADPAGVRLALRVVDDRTGTPLEGLDLRLMSLPAGGEARLASDPHGRATAMLPGRPDGATTRYVLTARRIGYATLRDTLVVPAAGAVRLELRLWPTTVCTRLALALVPPPNVALHLTGRPVAFSPLVRFR